MTRLVLILSAPLWAQDPASGAAPWLSAPGSQGPALEKPVWAQAAAGALPAAAPWLQSPGGMGVGGTTRPATIALEETWTWERLRGDLELVGRARAGLESDVRALRSRRGRLLVKDPKTGSLLPDNLAEAASIWLRVLDRLIALDSLVLRYGRFEEVQDEEKRAGAFLAAFSAYAAWSHGALEWSRAAADPALTRLFDARQPALGLKGGAFSALRAAVASPSRREALGEALAYSRAHVKSGAALKTGEAAAFALSGIRADTLGVPPVGGAAVPVPVLEPVTRPVSAAGAWTAGELEASWAKPKPAPELDFSAPAWTGARPRDNSRAAQPQGERLSASLASLSPFSQPWTGVAGATEAVAELYEESALTKLVRRLVEPSTGPLPAALIVPEQLASLNDRLEPGDILLWRRDRYLEEPGLGGWWSGAGLYVGTPEERERLTKATDLDGRLNAAAPEAYWSGLKPDGGFPKRLVLAAAGGVRLAALERAAAADSLVALRPRVPRSAREQAVLRAFTAVGRPYDGAYDASDPKALYSVELVLWAYAETPLVLEPRAAAEAGPPSPNDLARTYDSQFGTSKESLDVVRFLDGKEAHRRSFKAEPEDFRLSWKRPRWRFEDRSQAAVAPRP